MKATSPYLNKPHRSEAEVRGIKYAPDDISWLHDDSYIVIPRKRISNGVKAFIALCVLSLVVGLTIEFWL